MTQQSPGAVLSRSVMSTLCDPMDCSPPGSSVHRDSPGKNTGVGCHALLQGNLPNPGTESRSLALQLDSLPAELPGEPRPNSEMETGGAGPYSSFSLPVTCRSGQMLSCPRPQFLEITIWWEGMREGRIPHPCLLQLTQK